MSLTNPQKAALAKLVIRSAADTLAAFEDEPGNFPESSVLGEIDMDDLRDQVGRWLHRLPGSYWDTRLPHP